VNRFIIILGSCISLSINVFGQNLVLNNSLDQFITCPSFGQFGATWINDWSKPTVASSDYFNYNCPSINPTKQQPKSGEGYAGIICYNFSTEYREYITGEFSSPLLAGKSYEVEYYVSLNDGYIQAIHEVDAYLSVVAPGPFPNALHIPVTPQITNQTGALDDTSAWVSIKGVFVATGGEQFITIGNFNDDTNTTISQPGSSGSFGAYYFIDEVSVTEMNTTGIVNHNFSEMVHVFNNGNGILAIQCDYKFPIDKDLIMRCFDIHGRKFLDLPFVKRNEQLEIERYPEGVYILEISNGSDIRILKKFYK